MLTVGVKIEKEKIIHRVAVFPEEIKKTAGHHFFSYCIPAGKKLWLIPVHCRYRVLGC